MNTWTQSDKLNILAISLTILGIIIGAFCGITAIIAEITNQEIRCLLKLDDCSSSDEHNPMIDNPLAEQNGIIWNAVFYSNKELETPIVLEGQIKGARNGLRVDWKNRSPSKDVPVDYFSAIFRAEHIFDLGDYCFVVIVDDGAKLLIDGMIIRDAWWGYTPGAVYKNPLRLEQGPHNIEIQYYEEFENASFHVSWNPVSGQCITTGHPGVE